MEVYTAPTLLIGQSVTTPPVAQVPMVVCRAPSQVSNTPVLPGGRKEVAAVSSKTAMTIKGEDSKAVTRNASSSKEKDVTGKLKLPPAISVHSMLRA